MLTVQLAYELRDGSIAVLAPAESERIRGTLAAQHGNQAVAEALERTQKAGRNGRSIGAEGRNRQ
jgi:hypothetical protein